MTTELTTKDGKDPPSDESGPPTKKQRLDDATAKDASNGFNAATDVDNASDLKENTLPLLPRDCQILLLDIEGCTTSISFVHDVLFPFAKNQLQKYTESLSEEKLEEIASKLDQDLAQLPSDHPSMLELEKAPKDCSISDKVLALMNHDVKATGLKWLQGLIWKSGYQTGELKGHVYQDFKPLLEWCKTTGVSANIYSSGSIAAQKLLFGNSQEGDLLSFLDHHFDTTSGPKKTAASYQTIAKALNVGAYTELELGWLGCSRPHSS